MKKEKSTLILVDKNGFTQQSLNVSNRLALHWKQYLIGIIAALIIIGLGIGYFIYKQTSTHYVNKMEQLEQMNTSNVQEHTALYQTMEQIDAYVSKINGILDIKGLQQYTATTLEERTHASKELLAANLQSLQLIAKEINENPIGLPHDGRITSNFGPRIDPVTGTAGDNHSGIDFKGQIGETVKATAQGTVVKAGVQNGYGNTVIVEHKNGVKTLYAHLDKISVKENQEVQSGTKVGELGNTGKSTGSHLHYEVIENGQKVNPTKYMKL